jgi:hypothetical protein
VQSQNLASLKKPPLPLPSGNPLASTHKNTNSPLQYFSHFDISTLMRMELKVK